MKHSFCGRDCPFEYLCKVKWKSRIETADHSLTIFIGYLELELAHHPQSPGALSDRVTLTETLYSKKKVWWAISLLRNIPQGILGVNATQKNSTSVESKIIFIFAWHYSRICLILLRQKTNREWFMIHFYLNLNKMCSW